MFTISESKEDLLKCSNKVKDISFTKRTRNGIRQYKAYAIINDKCINLIPKGIFMNIGQNFGMNITSNRSEERRVGKEC